MAITVEELLRRYAAGERFFSRVALEGGNLSGVDLRGIRFQNSGIGILDLSGANLAGVSFVDTGISEVNLEGANLAGADLSGAAFTNVNCRRANLAGASFYKRSVYDSDFEGANFRGADLSFAEFSRCNMRNICLLEVIWNDESSLSQTDLTGAVGFDPGNVCGYRLILPSGEEIEFTEKLVPPQ